MARNHVKYRKIGGQGSRKIKISGSGCLQGKDCGQKNCCRQAAGQHRVQGKAARCLQPPQRSLGRCQDHPRNHINHHKKADHDGDIVIGQDREAKGNAVKLPLPLLHQALQAPQNQGEQHNTVQPHDIPAVGCHISAERIKDSEQAGSKVHSAAVPAQIPGKAHARQRCLKHDQNRHKLDNQSIRAEKQKPVYRAGQIIGIERRKINSQSNVPGIKQASSLGQLVLKFRKKWGVLMIHIRPEKALLPKGKDSSLGKYNNHHCNGNEKSGRHAI